jgi:cystine transport system substrate-binding protein
MEMKRRTFISMMAVAAAAGAVSLTGCGSASSSTAANTGTDSAAASADLLDTIQARGSIVVAMEGNWTPWTYHDENDVLVGFDVEVAQAIAAKLGVDADFVEGDWDGLFAGLESGRYDVVCNGVEITEERAETYNFTTPYGYIRTALAVRSDNEDIRSFEDLAGKKTANSISSTYMMMAEEYGAEVSGVDTLDETIQMLLAGRVDATLNAEVSFYDYLSAHPDAGFKIVALTDDASEVAIPVRKGEENESLLAAMNTAIEELRADGTLSEISVKYFGSDISQNG